jgi:hypothetical protein
MTDSVDKNHVIFLDLEKEIGVDLGLEPQHHKETLTNYCRWEFLVNLLHCHVIWFGFGLIMSPE